MNLSSQLPAPSSHVCPRGLGGGLQSWGPESKGREGHLGFPGLFKPGLLGVLGPRAAGTPGRKLPRCWAPDRANPSSLEVVLSPPCPAPAPRVWEGERAACWGCSCSLVSSTGSGLRLTRCFCKSVLDRAVMVTGIDCNFSFGIGSSLGTSQGTQARVLRLPQETDLDCDRLSISSLLKGTEWLFCPGPSLVSRQSSIHSSPPLLASHTLRPTGGGRRRQRRGAELELRVRMSLSRAGSVPLPPPHRTPLI